MIRIIGDLILDKWYEGKYVKISPEAPVKILEKDNSTMNLGGAANLSANLKNLNCKVKLYGSIADDNNGKKIKQLLKKSKISNFISKNSNITTTKTRLVNKNGKHLLRMDEEKYKLDLIPEKKILNEINKKDIVVISDYCKGVIGKKTVQKIIKKNNAVFVDPKNDSKIYSNSFLVKPNMKQLEEWIGNFNKKNCFKLLKKRNWKWLVVTDGKRGVHIFNYKKEYKKYTHKTGKLKDVSGAGDTFLGVLVYAYEKGLDIFKSSEIACMGASKIVQKFKVNLIEERDLIFKKVFTNGVFDVLHKGHKELFKFCDKIGEKLIVGINSDNSVKLSKGKFRPYNNLKTRKYNLKKFHKIDEIISFKEKTPIKIIKKLKPDVVVKGGDYKYNEVVGKQYCKVLIAPYVKGYSSTKLLKNFKKV